MIIVGRDDDREVGGGVDLGIVGVIVDDCGVGLSSW